MIVNIKADKLKIGMFVDLSSNWVANPFQMNRFELSSQGQIEMIKDAGIKEVNVDALKSSAILAGLKQMGEVAANEDTVHTMLDDDEVAKRLADKNKAAEMAAFDSRLSTIPHQRKLPPKWEPEKFMSPKLLQAFNETVLPADTRARVVYQYALEIMKNIFNNPTRDNLITSKDGLEQVVEIIINENATANSLFKVVSLDLQLYTHSVNVGIKSLLLAKELYLRTNKVNLMELGVGFFLHDIGKINVDPNILYKQGKLTPEEFNKVKTHPYEGHKILSKLKMLSTEVWIVAMQHHEREDGGGYPCGLKAREIHEFARICAIADVFDALTAKRSYKEQKSSKEALMVMKNEMLTRFNLELFTKFLQLFKRA